MSPLLLHIFLLMFFDSPFYCSIQILSSFFTFPEHFWCHLIFLLLIPLMAETSFADYISHPYHWAMTRSCPRLPPLQRWILFQFLPVHSFSHHFQEATQESICHRKTFILQGDRLGCPCLIWGHQIWNGSVMHQHRLQTRLQLLLPQMWRWSTLALCDFHDLYLTFEWPLTQHKVLPVKRRSHRPPPRIRGFVFDSEDLDNLRKL